MMKVLCVADSIAPELYQHFAPERFGKIELVISCGDLPPEYLTFLASAFKAPLFYVRGNHDIRYAAKPPGGCEDIHGRVVRHGALKLVGLEGSRWYNGGPQQYTENQMLLMAWRLRPRIWWHGGADIIITHAPPRFVHDAEDPCHRGFKCYHRLMRWTAPRYFLHGHIHGVFSADEQRITRLGRTQVINCFRHYTLDIDEDRIAAKN